MAKMLTIAPETWEYRLTERQCEMAEYLAKQEAEWCRQQMAQTGACPWCHLPMSEDDYQDGHERDCLYLAAVELAQIFDTE
jgi:hypothetical protein